MLTFGIYLPFNVLLCPAEAQGLSCEFNGRVYQHAEDFRPSCMHQCSCMNGVVGCMPVCPHLGPTPRCSRPRLATAPDGCCEEWVCEDDNSIPEEKAGLAARSHPPDLPRSLPNYISPWLLPLTPQNHQQPGAQLSIQGTLRLLCYTVPSSRLKVQYTIKLTFL